MNEYLLGALIFAAWVPAVMFPLVYRRVAWRRSRVGRSTMTLAVVIAIALTIPLVRLFVGDPEWMRWTRAVVYLLIITALWRQLIVLLHVQRRDRAGNTENV